MRRSLAKFSESEASNHTPFLAGFTTTTPELKFSVHTTRSDLVGVVQRDSREPFFLHLLRGCVLFESILKESPIMLKNPGTLEKAISRASGKMGVASQLKISAGSFDKRVLQEIKPNMLAVQAAEYAAKCRNTLGHSLVWETPSLNKAKYDLLVEIIASACIHAISTTYR
jgi:hypothetical protein